MSLDRGEKLALDLVGERPCLGCLREIDVHPEPVVQNVAQPGVVVHLLEQSGQLPAQVNRVAELGG